MCHEELHGFVLFNAYYHGEEFDDDQEAVHVKYIQSFSW